MDFMERLDPTKHSRAAFAEQLSGAPNLASAWARTPAQARFCRFLSQVLGKSVDVEYKGLFSNLCLFQYVWLTGVIR